MSLCSSTTGGLLAGSNPVPLHTGEHAGRVTLLARLSTENQPSKETSDMQILGPKTLASITLGSGAAAQTARADLPRDRFIQKLIVRMAITGDTAGAVTPDEDAIAALISQIRVVANGSDQRVAASGWELWRYNSMRSQIDLPNSLLTTISQSNVEIGVVEFTIDFAVNQNARTNQLDSRALLPAHMLTSLRVEFDIAAASALGTGYTVDSGVIELAVKEVSMSQDEVDELLRRGLFAYYLTSESHTIAAASTNFGFNANLPVGKIIRRSAITSFRAGVRINGDDAAGTGNLQRYRVRDKRRGDVDLIDQTWTQSQTQDGVEYGLAPGTGFTIADLDALGSLDARGYAQGQVQVQSNNAAPSGVTEIKLLTESIV